MTNTSSDPHATPMTRDELAIWLRRFVGENVDIVPMIEDYAGRTIDEMERLHDAQHGSMA